MAGRRPHVHLLRTLRGSPAALVLLAAVVAPLRAGAQEVRLADSPGNDAERSVAAFLERGGYAVWPRDTVLARADVVESHVLVLESSARIAGRIAGDVLVLDGDLFLRTGGRVDGDVTVLGGGFYDSDLAEVGGSIAYRPNELIRVRPTGGDWEVFAVAAEREAFELDGTRGFHLPVYQRVDAVTLGWGAIARFDDVAGRPDLEGRVRFLAGPGDLEGSLRASIYPSERLRLGVAASRATRTMDGWIRPVWYNSLSTVVADDDLFDYYASDRLGLEMELRAPEAPAWEDPPRWSFALGAFVEDVESRAARDVWALFEDDDPEEMPAARHPNPAVGSGEYYSLTAGFEWLSRVERGRTGFGLGLEYGLAGESNLVSEDWFLLAEGRVSARRATAWGHAVDVFAISRLELGGDVPGQRHSTIGGPGTLAILPLRSLRGPELLYADVTYAVPLLGMATLGGLDVFVRGSAGSAWGDGLNFELEETGSGGLAVRLWEFQMETGLAVGAASDGSGTEAVWFFDVRTSRSARPTSMAPAGRGF